jgi:hypothetical protein
MTKFLEGSVVALSIPLGISGTATASYRVYDETGSTIVASTPLVLGTDAESAEITVQAADNALGGKARSYRTIEVLVTLASGEKKRFTGAYLLEGLVPEEIPATSFQTYESAMMVASMLTDVAGWSLADEDARKKALREAHFRINLLRFDLVEATEFPDFPSVDALAFKGQVGGMSLSEFNALPEEFLQALREAQVIEADAVLGGGNSLAAELNTLREAGVVQHLVGESSVTFNKTTVAKKSASRRALERLSRFIDHGRRLTRV